MKLRWQKAKLRWRKGRQVFATTFLRNYAGGKAGRSLRRRIGNYEDFHLPEMKFQQFLKIPISKSSPRDGLQVTEGSETSGLALSTLPPFLATVTAIK